jgi:hypothetical protein
MDQLELWDQQVQEDATATRDAARDRWIAARRLHAIGSAEEVEVWNAYREAADRLAAIIRAQRACDPALSRL